MGEIVKETKERWKDLGFKAKLMYVTAIVSFIIGWALTIANFFGSENYEVQDTTLFILGQSLLYCGSVLGIVAYTQSEFKKIRDNMK